MQNKQEEKVMTLTELKKVVNSSPVGTELSLESLGEQSESLKMKIDILSTLGFVRLKDTKDSLVVLKHVPDSFSEDRLSDDADARKYLERYREITGSGHIAELDTCFCKCLHCSDSENCYGRSVATGRILRELAHTLNIKRFESL